MSERDAGYPQALADVQSEVRRTVQDPRTSTEGRLELLGMLSFLSELVDVKVQAYHMDAAVSADEEDRGGARAMSDHALPWREITTADYHPRIFPTSTPSAPWIASCDRVYEPLYEQHKSKTGSG